MSAASPVSVDPHPVVLSFLFLGWLLYQLPVAVELFREYIGEMSNRNVR